MKSFFGNLGVRVALGLLWLLQWLPLPVLAALGTRLGHLLYKVAGSRRRIALRNLELCFPNKSAQERETIAKEHFGWLARSLLERAMLWWSPPERIKNLIQIEGDVELAEREAEVFFPAFDRKEWREVSATRVEADADNEVASVIRELERRA